MNKEIKTLKEYRENLSSWADEKTLDNKLNKALGGFLYVKEFSYIKDPFNRDVMRECFCKLASNTRCSLIMNIKKVMKDFHLKLNKKFLKQIEGEVNKKKEKVSQLSREYSSGGFDEVIKMVENPKEHWKGLLVLAIFTGHLSIIDDEPKAVKRFGQMLKAEFKKYPDRKNKMSEEVKDFVKKHKINF